MAVRKKKKSTVEKNEVFNWTPQRKAVALMMSTGTKTQREISIELHLNERTISNWKNYPAFLEEVESLTLKNETFTRAGLLKECLKGLTLKVESIEGDRSTHLDYIKMIADLQGHTKQKIEIDAKMKHSTFNPEEMTEEELQQVIDENIKKLTIAGYLPITRTD